MLLWFCICFSIFISVAVVHESSFLTLKLDCVSSSLSACCIRCLCFVVCCKGLFTYFLRADFVEVSQTYGLNSTTPFKIN